MNEYNVSHALNTHARAQTASKKIGQKKELIFHFGWSFSGAAHLFLSDYRKKHICRMAVARFLFGYCSMCSRILLISSLIRLITKRITLTQTLNRFQFRDGIQNWFVHNCQRQDIFVSYFLDNLFVRTFQSHTSTSHECGRCFHDVPKNPQNNRMFLKSWRKINWIYEQENEQCTERWS